MLRCLPKQWQEGNLGHANDMIGLGFIDDRPIGDPDTNLRLYDFLRDQNQRASHFIIGAKIHDNPQRRSGRRQLPLYSQGIGHRRRDIGRQSITQHADWYDQYSHCLLSLLTCLRPASSPPLIAEVQEPSATLPPSALNAAFPSPVLPPGLPCTEATPMPAQGPVLSFPSPASLDSLAEHFFDEFEHHARAPAVPYAQTGRSYLQRKPQRRLRLDYPHWCLSPYACRATIGHRS